jgi:hypothetical protein
VRDVFGGECHVEEVVFVWVGGGHFVGLLLWYVLPINKKCLLKKCLVCKLVRMEGVETVRLP